MALPPIHRLDAPMVFVFPDDGAWDDERFRQETADMSPEDKAAHPVTRYVTCQTRFDIEPVAQYLRMEEQPARFYLRRLTLQQWARARDLALRGEGTLAAFYCLQHGLLRVDGVPGLQHLDSSSRPFSEQDTAKIAEVISFPRAIKVGEAIMAANGEITEAEGKA
jgi:hypothetical protein